MLGLNKRFAKLSAKSRKLKMKLLSDAFELRESSRVLDIGGEMDPSCPQVIGTHPNPGNVTVVNVDQGHLDAIQAEFPDVVTRVADARSLPFPDDSFDLVYSNAVIEHVGTLQDQQAMAREVMRVGRSWFITTPNRWFPFEFHTRLPLIGWLPAPLMKRLARVWSYSHVRGRYESGLETDTRLMTSGELRKMFPTSRLIRCRVTVWPETLVVVGAKAAVALPGRDGARRAM